MRRIVPLVLLTALIAPGKRSQGQAPGTAHAWLDTLMIPAYVEEAPDPNPPFDFFQPARVNYPYTIRDHLTDRRAARTWRTLYLENEYLRCSVLPDLGGHLYSCRDKLSGAEVFYANRSIKLTQIGYRGAWAALGVEFNFPVSHNWMTTSPVDFALTNDSDGSASVWIGNVDRITGMQWRVQLTLRPGRAVLEQHTTLFNRSALRHRFYWWTNAAVRVWDDSRIIYPMRYTASHGFTDVDTWPVDARGTDNSVVGNHLYGPVSRFSYGSREPWMAVYHPRTSAGLVHWSSPLDLPAKKIWSWGGDANGLRWRRALSDDNSAYVEIQRGLFRDQETYGFLEPRETVAFSEYWVPIRELGWVSQATPDAVVGLWRSDEGGGPALEIRLNVTRRLAGAAISVRGDAGVLYADTTTLTPERTWSHALPLPGASAPLTFMLLDAGGAPLIAHTEGVYDYTPDSLIALGRQAAYQFPPTEQRSEGDVLALGEVQEREGRVLAARATYRAGLDRYPGSLPLLRAAGRLSVGLKQYDVAAQWLAGVLSRVSNDYESAYYFGLAQLGRGDTAAARRAFETAQGYGRWRTPARFELAALTARGGRQAEALRLLQTVGRETPEDTRAGGLEVALLRWLGRSGDARRRLASLLAADPTAAFLRLEAVRLGERDDALWRHLAADPERIIEVAVDYIRFGLFDEALDLLSRDYPTGPSVVTEPGMPSPSAYPLIAYYRGYVHRLAGENGAADLAMASRQPTTYVFPNRPETFPVLRAALEHDPDDATAHFLLGGLFLSGGMADSALAEWEVARGLEPGIPTLHRNMGYALLYAGGSLARSEELFREGMRLDSLNAGLYFGLDEVLRAAGRPTGDRADVLLEYPDRAGMPAALVYLAARALSEAGRFDEAERLFANRFFPSEEGGTNPRDVYLDVRVARAKALGGAGKCRAAIAIASAPVDRRARLTFADDELWVIAVSPRVRQAFDEVRAACSR